MKSVAEVKNMFKSFISHMGLFLIPKKYHDKLGVSDWYYYKQYVKLEGQDLRMPVNFRKCRNTGRTEFYASLQGVWRNVNSHKKSKVFRNID
jgi:hypothetical protein